MSNEDQKEQVKDFTRFRDIPYDIISKNEEKLDLADLYQAYRNRWLALKQNIQNGGDNMFAESEMQACRISMGQIWLEYRRQNPEMFDKSGKLLPKNTNDLNK